MSELSLESGTENPRVENPAITPVNMHPEGSDLIEAFLWLKVFVEGDIPVFFDQRGFIDVGFGYAFTTNKHSEKNRIYLQY